MSDKTMSLEEFKQRRVEIGKLLRSTGGQALLNMLEGMWCPSTLMGETPEKTAYNVALRDAYTMLYDMSKLEDTPQ